ncbi:unnamed protein product [Allacma fusca]|uniref:Major facilitator superfamily associated domain-containing protein n=1 Tax=Allacma fusca TaxID=39272 RepID=A0A8J2J0S4_9HEXA|nr:unnamed protein product [Allacma fusca]
MGRADEETPKADVPSVANDHAEDVGLDYEVEGPDSTFYSPSSPAKKKSCCPNCLNKSLVGLKALLFLFYGGIGVIVTWLNHLQISRRLSEKECLLAYGISSILSIFTPFVFGLISDKSAQPKKVLAVCFLLAGIFYPLFLFVPPAAPHDFKSRYERCSDPNSFDNGSYCLPSKFNCSTGFSELISNSGGCSEGCRGKLILSNCDFIFKNESHSKGFHGSQSESEYYDYGGPAAQAQTAPASYDTTGDDDEEGEPWTPSWPPHICIGTESKSPRLSEAPLCYAFYKDRTNITVDVSDISGNLEDDGKCHYPLLHYSPKLRRYQHLLYCSPISPNCQVSCDLYWDVNEVDQWSCSSDFIQWAIAFGSFVAVHTIGTMLLISAAGLLNVAILSMTHEHRGYFGCQLTYAALGYALLTPSIAYLFEFLRDFQIPWSLDYIAVYAGWLIVSALLALTLPHHAEWVPKPGTIGPMLRRWSCRGHTVLFFLILIILGGFQGLAETLAFFQIKHTGATLFQFGLGGTAAMIPALLFIYRVEKVIDYCGYHNVLAIAMVVLSLQFTGYAYLRDVMVEWSYLLRGMETFSVVTVWAAAAHTTYNAAPRSLVATCQSIIVTLYCCFGRGIGCCLGYVALLYMSREIVLKILSISSVIICILYLLSYYCLLKPNPYSRHYDTDHGFAPSGKYTPLKLLQGKKGKEDKKAQIAHKASEEVA